VAGPHAAPRVRHTGSGLRPAGRAGSRL